MKAETKNVLFGATLLAASFSTAAAEFGKDVDNTQHAVDNMRAEAAQAISVSVDEQSSEDLAYEFLDKAVAAKFLEQAEGWQEGKNMFVALGTAVFDEPDPDLNPNFLKLRALKSIEASLNAKRTIIEFVRTEISVDNMVTLPSTGLSTEFDSKLAGFKNEIERKLRAYQRALATVDKARAAEIDGITAADLTKAGISATLDKTMASAIDLAGLAKDKADRLKKAQAEFLSLDNQLSALKSEAETLQGSLAQQNTTNIETLAAMPLSGAITVGQFESWLDGEYAVTNVVLWSPDQERITRSIAKNETTTLPPGKMSLGEYIAANNWATATGGRKLVDKYGNLHIIGIGAWPLERGSAARRVADLAATRLAQQVIATTIRSDVSAKSAVQLKAQEIRESGLDGKKQTHFAENMAEQLSESVEGLNMQGVQRVFGRKLKSPLTGKNMFVAVMVQGVTQSTAAASMEKQLYSGANEVVNAQQRSRGAKAGLTDSYESAIKDTTHFNAGRTNAKAAQTAQPGIAARPLTQSTRTKPGQKSIRGAGSSIDAFGY